jgi:hypothetical protein
MMLEGQSHLVPRPLLAGCCDPDSDWAYHLAHEVSVLSGQRPAPEDGFQDMDDEADGGGNRSKSPSPQPHTPDITKGHGSSLLRRLAAAGLREQSHLRDWPGPLHQLLAV